MTGNERFCEKIYIHACAMPECILKDNDSRILDFENVVVHMEQNSV